MGHVADVVCVSVSCTGSKAVPADVLLVGLVSGDKKVDTPTGETNLMDGDASLSGMRSHDVVLAPGKISDGGLSSALIDISNMLISGT